MLLPRNLHKKTFPLQPYSSGLFPLLIISFLHLQSTGSKTDGSNCPQQIQSPCSCLPLPSQKVGIYCAGGLSLEHLLVALQPFHGWSRPIELLRIEDTPIPMLYLDSLGTSPLSSLAFRRLILRNNSLSHFLIRPSSSSSSSPQLAIFDSVEHLEISQNELANFADCSAVAAFRNLRSLSLSGNRFGHVPAQIFLHFHSRRSLQQLDLSANWLSEGGLPSDAFLGLESLQRLSLDKNQLSRVPTEAIGELADSLEELFLSANQIDQIQPGQIPPLPQLKSLGMDANQISWLNGEAFLAIPSLWYLYLGQNQFPSIPPAMLSFVPELKVLTMAGNPILRLDFQTFQMAPSLLRLDLSNCRIGQIHSATFSAIPRLQSIHLGGNQLEHVGNDLFAGKLPFLVVLDLAKNRISHVDGLAFTGLGQLQTLDISGNLLHTFGPNVFRDTFPQAMAHLQTVDLDENPLDCGIGKINWLLALRGRVRLKGSCTTPGNLKGTELASMALNGWEGINTNKIGDGRNSLKDRPAAGMAKIGSREEMATENVRGTTRTDEMPQPSLPMETTKSPWPWPTKTPTMSPSSSISTTTATMIGTFPQGGQNVNGEVRELETENFGGEMPSKKEEKHQEMATKITAQKTNMNNSKNSVEQQQGETNSAILLLVLIIIAIGLTLAALSLLAIRVPFFRFKFQSSAAESQSGNENEGKRWPKLKLFGPSTSFKSYVPNSSIANPPPLPQQHLFSRNAFPSSLECPPSPAHLTTLNFFNSLAPNKKMFLPFDANADHPQQQNMKKEEEEKEDEEWSQRRRRRRRELAMAMGHHHCQQPPKIQRQFYWF